MAEFRYPSQTRVGTQAAVDQGLRSYMLGIYNYMALGVAVTAAIVMATFTIPALGAVANVLAFPALIGLIGMGFFAQRLLMGGTVARAHVVYWVYVALWGIGIAPIVNRYLGIDPSMVMTAFLSASLGDTTSFFSATYSATKCLSGFRVRFCTTIASAPTRFAL